MWRATVAEQLTEVSTATGDPASAAGGEDDADGSQTTEFDRRTSTTALATTSGSDDATVTPSSTDPPATSSTATIGSTETTAPPTSEPTTEAPTTAPTTTAASQETTEPTVARPAEAPALAGIGDAVTLDSASGPGVGAVRVSLYADPDGDGEGDSLQQSTTTSTAGRYAFTPTPGCYVIQFSAPDGYRVEPDDERQVVCLQPGQAVSDVDAVVYRVRPPAPSGCFVEKAGGGRRGVEVFEDDGAWAPSYTFYDKDGDVVVRTRDIGPADDVEGPTNHEWHGEANGFDHRDVRSVAAERNGLESQPVTCDR